MPSYTYDFYCPPSEIYRPYLPVNFVNPIDNRAFLWYSLVDTGADASLVTSSIARLTGHNLKGDGVRSDVTMGVRAEDMATWEHTFRFELMDPGQKRVVWTSKPQLVDCIEHDEFPPILGQLDFLRYFKITFDYPNRKLTVSW